MKLFCPRIFSSLRTVVVALMVLFILVSAFLVYLTSVVVFNRLQAVTIDTYAAGVRAVGDVFIARHTGGVREQLLRGFAADPAVRFFRLVDTDAARVIESSAPDERGALTPVLPGLTVSALFFTYTQHDTESLANIYYQISGNELLWLGVERTAFIQPTIDIVLVQAVSMLGLCALLFFMLYRVGKQLVLTPLRIVHASLEEIGAGKFGTRLPERGVVEFQAITT